MVDIKYCPECSTEKSVGDFYKNKARPDGLQSLCKICLNARTKALIDENTQAIRSIVKQNSRGWRYE